jgi:hypothetical protein
MKNIIRLLLIACLVLPVSSCSDNEDGKGAGNVESITFDGVADTIFMKKGDTLLLKPVTKPANSSLRFYSSNSKVFKVNQNTGEVAAVGGGFGEVIAIAPNGDSWTKALCHISVSELVEKIDVAPDAKLQILPSGRVYIPSFLTISPASATNQKLRYETSDSSIVKVDNATGYVTFVSRGHATVTAHSTDGSNVVSEAIDFYAGYRSVDVSHIPSWKATASTSQPGYSPSLAIDQSISSFWHANWSAPQPHPYYLQVDMGIARQFNEIAIYRRLSYMDTRDVEIYVSGRTDDGVTWTDPSYKLWGSISYGDEPASVYRKTFGTFPKTTVTARYFVLKFLNTNRNDGDQSLAEIYVHYIN